MILCSHQPWVGVRGEKQQNRWVSSGPLRQLERGFDPGELGPFLRRWDS